MNKNIYKSLFKDKPFHNGGCGTDVRETNRRIKRRRR